MKDFVLSIVAILVIFVGLPFLLLWLRDRLFGRPKKNELDEYSRRFCERLANPDVAGVESHFGHALPGALLALFEDSEELDRGNFEIVSPDASERWFVAFYTPLDLEELGYTFHDSAEHLAFANDGCGNAYLVNPREPDPAVLFHDHETGEIQDVAPSLSAFLGWERREPER